jgi:NADPH2:quinone reductase
MRAIAIEAFGGPEQLRLMDLPRPVPGKGEILLRVVAAGVNPVDWMIREGRLRDSLPHTFPLIPGWDAAGVIEELGDGATRFRKGDRVWAFARKPTVQWGCYADYVAVPEAVAALMPSKLLFEEAAAIPQSGLTAYQGLFGDAELERESTVLVLGAAGGVGHLAVQLARHAGARVVGTGGSDSQSFILGLGATAAIDYTREKLADAVGRHCPDGVDLVLDTVGGDEQQQALAVVRRGGRLVSIVAPPDPEAAREHGVMARLHIVEPESEHLTLLARLVDGGKLQPRVQKIYPLAKAADAQTTSQAGHVHGKLVLNL